MATTKDPSTAVIRRRRRFQVSHVAKEPLGLPISRDQAQTLEELGKRMVHLHQQVLLELDSVDDEGSDANN